MIFSGTILWLLPVFVLTLWLIQNVSHEGAHALTAIKYGAKIVDFWPFPSTKLGTFTFAHVSWQWGEAGAPSNKGRALISGAPLILNTVLVTVLLASRFLFPEMGAGLATFLSAWMLTNYVDGAVSLGTFYRPEPEFKGFLTDGWSVKHQLGVPTLWCRVTAVLWHLAFGFLVLIPVI
jgi:hypothetical protein